MRLTAALFSLSIALVALASAQERLPMLTPDKMSDAQKKAVADYKATRKVDLGPGPFAVLARVPDLLVPSLHILMHNQFNSALSPRLTELAIIIASRHYTNNYEWNSHYADALKAGLSADLIAAIADGRRPSPMTDDEAAIFQMDKVKTPTHMVAGADDIRVAVLEDYLLEHALYSLGVPNRLLIFPGEGHSLGKNPWHGKIKVREELKWLEKYGGIPVSN